MITMQSRKTSSGFTLIELVIAVAIVGILAAIAIPAYTESVRKSRRADAQSALTGLAAAMERDFLRTNQYNNPFAGAGIYPSRVPLDGGTATYTLSATVTATTYTVRATPTGPQTGDRCGVLALTSAGAKTPTTPDDCWRR